MEVARATSRQYCHEMDEQPTRVDGTSGELCVVLSSGGAFVLSVRLRDDGLAEDSESPTGVCGPRARELLDTRPGRATPRTRRIRSERQRRRWGQASTRVAA
ncbi:hypothetical protein KRMM14A1259_25250 [Krasilnikovia sp. MM14-A1259]